MPTSNPLRQAAVIGSGFGGLAAAIRLASAGVKTTIYERLDKPGGRAYVYEDKGFTFDAGPTVITAPDCLEELFQLSGRSMSDYVELMPVSPMYRLFWEDGTTFDYAADEETLLSEIARLSPDDVEGYKKYLAYATEVFKTGYLELCHVPFLKFWDMVRVAPDLLRLSAQRPVYGTVCKYFKSDKLRQAFSFNSLLIGGNPFKASSIYTLIHPLERKWGVFFPRGGTHALVRALVRLFEDLGGTVELNCGVREILTQPSKRAGKKAEVVGLVDEHGKRHDADLIISNADVTRTYERLLAKEPAAAKPAKALRSRRHSMSLFVLYFGTKKAYPGLTHHNVMFGKRYKELLRDIFDRGIVADDFSLYLHAPTLTDPTLAPEGGHSFYVLSPVPHLGKSKVDWKDLGPKYADRILSYLEEHYMPGLKGDIVTQRMFTPLDFESRLDSHLGAAFSLEPTLTQSAYFRVHNRDEHISGLYFAGAGTHPGAGVPGVIGSAKATHSVIEGDYALGKSGLAAAKIASKGKLKDSPAHA